MSQRNVGTATATLSHLKALGVQLHIDNFGTVYSSVPCLHRLPINALKIDRAFVTDMGKDDELQIVKASLRLAHNLSLDVPAIGVETAQLTQLMAIKCQYGQGSFFSAPLDLEGVEALMTTNIGPQTLE